MDRISFEWISIFVLLWDQRTIVLIDKSNDIDRIDHLLVITAETRFDSDVDQQTKEHFMANISNNWLKSTW